MSGLILNGVVEDVPGLACKSWLDDPRLRLKMGEDGGRRASGVWIRAIVLHTTRGIPGGKDLRPQQVLSGAGPAANTALATNQWWSGNGQCAGAHLVVDFDGSVACMADLISEVTYHATSVNPHTIGIEIAQGRNAELWEAQLDAIVTLIDWLTLRLGIQRQIPDTYRGPLTRLTTGGKNVTGVYGHRDQSRSRGPGDPGDAVFERLSVAGYERFNLESKEDLATWARRQRALGVQDDGLPGLSTCAAIRSFQSSLGWEPTGIADGATRHAFDTTA